MYESSKQSKYSQTAKMTTGVQIVTCLHRVRRIHKAAQTPLPRETFITCAWAVATARRPWAGLTLCVYMDVHASGSRSLPRAATLSSIATDDACSSSSLSTTVIKFSRQRCDTILCISRAVTTEELPTESITWNLTEKLNEKLDPPICVYLVVLTTFSPNVSCVQV